MDPKNMAIKLRLKKPSYRTSLIVLGIVATAILAMVVTIGVIKFGGVDQQAADANEAVSSDENSLGFSLRPTSMPTAAVSNERAPTDAESTATSNPTESPTLAPTGDKPSLRPTTSTDPKEKKPKEKTETSSPTSRPSLSPTKTPTISTTLIPTSQQNAATYVPGDLTANFRGLKLSRGLSGSRLAKTDSNVKLIGDTRSDVEFGSKPETAAVFEHPSGDGWIYLINFDRQDGQGGVGALTFNSDGIAIKYEKVLTDTSENTGGGASPWGTFISCENGGGKGQIFEVDPTGDREAKKTILGLDGGSYKGFAFDYRNELQPRFFVAASDPQSFVMRYTPSDATMASQEDPAFRVLHEEGGTFEYLVAVPNENDDSEGTFYWTDNALVGHISSNDYFQDIAGLTFVDGSLYVVSEEQKELFVLNLDSLEYKKESTENGAFEGDPSEVVHILKSTRRLNKSKDEQPILYFTETNDSSSGVHGRTRDGKYVIIAEDEEDRSDAVGLAFSPDRRHLYFALKGTGEVFGLTRDDGLPFDGATLDIAFSE